jgi:hypothetical protein
VRELARTTVTVAKAGDVTVRLRPGAALRLRLGRERKLGAMLVVKAVDRAGNASERSKALRFE